MKSGLPGPRCDAHLSILDTITPDCPEYLISKHVQTFILYSINILFLSMGSFDTVCLLNFELQKTYTHQTVIKLFAAFSQP